DAVTATRPAAEKDAVAHGVSTFNALHEGARRTFGLRIKRRLYRSDPSRKSHVSLYSAQAHQICTWMLRVRLRKQCKALFRRGRCWPVADPASEAVLSRAPLLPLHRVEPRTNPGHHVVIAR